MPVGFLECGAPPVISWFINPINYRYLRIVNPSDIEVKFTNLAIVNKGTTVQLISPYFDDFYEMMHLIGNQ